MVLLTVIPRSRSTVVALCVAALVGFAANSLLCRTALGDDSIDAASFTGIRLASGAVVLAALVWLRERRAATGGSWPSGAALFAYAAAFSFAYLRLTTATGALILFASVQATMIGWGVARGERPQPLEWLGFVIAGGGLVALTFPGLAAPDPTGAALMAAAGISWGIYSLRGRGATDPLAVTANNFARSLPLAAILVAIVLLARTDDAHVTTQGAVLAASSGAIASGIGYSLWYAALPHIPATRAAIVQLSVPVLAAVGGVVVRGEDVHARLAIAATAILGGVLLALLSRRR